MAKILVSPKNGKAPFEVEGTLTATDFGEPDGLIYYIGGWSYMSPIVTILEGEIEGGIKHE